MFTSLVSVRAVKVDRRAILLIEMFSGVIAGFLFLPFHAFFRAQ
jgi:hypothetical protein